MFCNKCGNKVELNQKYCNKCGNALTYKKSNKKLVHENYLCTWIGKPKK